MRTTYVIPLAILAFILCVFAWLNPSSRQDFWLNLLSEGVGIVVTVFIIDKLIKFQEERQRKPSQKVVYARLFEITSDIIETIVPVGGLTIIMLDIDMLVFGRSRVPVRIDTLQLQSHLPAMFYEIYRSLKKHKKFDTGKLSKASQKTLDVIDNSSSLLEVELLNLLYQMDNSIKSVEDGLSPPSLVELSDKQGEHPFLMSYSLKLNNLLGHTLNARIWLEKLADSRISAESMNKANEGFDIQKQMLEKSKKFAEATLSDDQQKKIVEGFFKSASDSSGSDNNPESA